MIHDYYKTYTSTVYRQFCKVVNNNDILHAYKTVAVDYINVCTPRMNPTEMVAIATPKFKVPTRYTKAATDPP